MKFIKMHGLGNDYVYFDCRTENSISDPPALSRRLSDRHFGVGGDGIVLILPDTEAHCRMRIFNADGSEAEMCGNAIRCVGKYLYEQSGGTLGDTLSVATGGGIKKLKLQTANGKVQSVRVNMGFPILNGREIPVALDAEQVVAHPLTVEQREFRVTCVSMGNPHCIVFTDTITDELLGEWGPRLECHPFFPQRINVEFVRIRNSHEIDMRVWERGSGETLACGTGASASAVACVLNNRTERKITVHLRGGDLEIEWAADGHLFMTGPATEVFRGELTA